MAKEYNRCNHSCKDTPEVKGLRYWWLGVCAMLFFAYVPGANAQNNEVSVNVQVLPPYSNNIYDYIGSNDRISRSFQEQILVTLRNNNPNRSYAVKLIASVLGNNGVEAIMNQNFQPFQRIILPAGEMKIISGRDLAEINRNLTENDITTTGIDANQIRRTGTLPEGDYRICFQAFDYGTGESLSEMEPFGCSPPVSISFPDPPVIAYPFNEAIILATDPQSFNISWAPVQNASPRLRYRIKIVELTDVNANPYDLMEQSNVAFYREDNLMTSNIFYDQTKPQLKVGNTYAIRVQAYDPLGQINIKNNGFSEINLFRYANSYDDGSGLADMDYINLVPGYVRLTNLDQLEYTQTAGVERFNGVARLSFINPLTEAEESVNVQVNNLSLNTENRQNPTFLSGSVTGSLSSLPELMQNMQGFIDPSGINWSYDEGLELEGDVALKDGAKIPVSGAVQLSPAGASGQFKAGGQQTPIYEIDQEKVRLKITEIIASFPEQTVKGNGFLEFLEQQRDSLSNGPCEVTGINLLQDEVAINVNCIYNASIPLVQNSDKVMFRFEGVSGTVLANWSTGSLDYDVRLQGVLDLKTDEGAYNCGINVSLDLDLGSDPQLNVLGNNCAVTDRTILLGLVQLNLRNIELDEISYQQGVWDFKLVMDGHFIIPMFDNWTSPEVEDIFIDKQGITISEQEWSLEELRDLQNIGWDSAVSLSPDQIRFDAITYPWYDAQVDEQGPWNMSAQGRASIRNLPIIPCLNEYDYDFRLYYNDQDGVYGELTGEGEGCSWDFSRESSITITQLQGELFAELKNERTVRSASLSLTGNLKNSFLFQCEKELDLDNVFLTIDKDFVRGSVKQFSPDCPLEIGPFGAEITSSTLLFEVRDGEQEVLLDANANLRLPDSTKIEGTFLYDLVEGEFIEIEFELADPFTWNIPEEDPVLSFYIKEAVINKEGFLIDGRNTLKLPGGKDIDATFDNLALDINTMEIERGRVIFDESFAFEAGIDTADYSLNFKAVEQGQSVTLNPALYFSLGTNVTLDSAGLKTGGNAEAKLLLGKQNFTEDLSIDFSEDFTFGLYPFNVSLGRADLLIKEQLIAYINDQGLTIDPLDFVLDALPEKIPLPDNDVAYLKIRDINGDLLIAAEKLPNGNISIETLEDENLQFYLPAVDPANPPVLGNVQLAGVQLNADISNPSIAQGTITVNVPENAPRLSNLDLPVKIRQIAFGTNLFGTNIQGLFMSGDLSLFETELPNAGDVFLMIDNAGYAEAAFNITGQNLTVPLVPNSDLVTYQLNSLSGNFAAYLDNISAQSFSLDLSGQFAINEQQTPVATADLDLHLEPGSFQITHFESNLSDNPIDLNLGDFGLKIKEIPALPVFNYTDAGGFDFAAELDLELYMELADGERFELPLDGLEVRPTGLHIPAQNINPGSIPGLSIPPIRIAGFELELLALRTTQPTVFDWYNVSEWNFSPSLDIALRMPELAAKGLNIPNGLSFYDVTIDDGIFSGSMAPFQPPGGLDVKLGNFPDAPELNIAKIMGELLPDSIGGGQDFNLDLEGELKDLPGFDESEVQACVNPAFSLSIIEGRAFEGTVSNFTPCGNLAIGPFTLTPQSSQLLFAYESGMQEVSLDGLVRLNLAENPTPNGLADGSVKLNLMTGSLMDGYIAINQSFPFDYPVENPLLSFTLNEARLDTTGFTMKGNGSLDVANITNTVAFNDLKLSLQDLSIKSGSANLGSNLNLDLVLSPFGLTLADVNAQRPSNDHLRMSLDADVMLTKDGIGYSGTSVAAIRFAGEDYPALRAEFLNNFALNPHNLSVTNGKAEFYYDENGQQATEPLAILDQNGFSMGGGVVALLPDTLGLPTKEVAYLILKDSQGNSLIEATQNASNGWDLSTKNNQPVTLVIPSLANGQTPPQAQVTFSLTTDSNYNPNGGSISLASAIDLEPNFELPIELTELSLIANNRTEVSASIKVNVPQSISNEPIASAFRINNNGFVQASLEWGTYTQSYDASLAPAFSHTIQGTLPNDTEQSSVAIHLYGLKAELGATKSLQLAGALESELLAQENQAPEPLFFYADYANQSWTGGVDAGYLTDGIKVGKLTLQPDPQQPFEVQISPQQFVIAVDGTIDFEELVGEPLQVSVQDLQIGVDYSQSNPTPIFGMGGGSVTLPDQTIDLFEGEVVLTLIGPSFQISGREITISSDGNIDVFEEEIAFSGMSVSSTNGFNLGTVQMNNSYELIPEYAQLTSLGLTQEQNSISLSASIDITLPEPVESTATANVTISRGSNKQVSIAVEGPEFDLNQRYAIGEIAEFELSKIAVDITPSDMSQFGIYAAGKLLIEDQPRVYFGDAASIRSNPGIAYANRILQYNATGNASFDLDEGFFNIEITANMSVSNATKFEVVLGGTAGVNINGVGGTLDYEGFTIGPDGITDRGNLAGSGSLTLMDFASLTIGQFQYEAPADGEQTVLVDLPVASSDPEAFDSQEEPGVQFVPTEVKRFVRFGGGGGPALELTLGGANPDEEGSGGFGGGVDEVMFYELPNGDKYLKIDNAHMAIGRTMSCSAFLEYKEENGGFILRATATAEVGIGNASATAAMAGYFANMNDELKFGLFVGVEVGTGIPLFPGVIDLKGGGAGFFYKPTQADLDLVTHPQRGALKAFGHKLVRDELSNPISPPAVSDYDFAVMLFAKVGVLGSAGTYSLEGSTFIQITNKSVYFDARGIVLGLDGQGATKLKLEGGAYVQAQFDHFFIDGGGFVDIYMPVVLNGHMDLIFFFAEDPAKPDEVVWAIDGGLEVTVYSMLEMKGTLIACPSGLYMDASVAADIIDVWPIKVRAKLLGAVWYVNDDSFRYPFGAYMTMDVEICLGFCIEPTAKAAFATLRGGGFELVVGAQACISTFFGDACLHGIAKAKSDAGFDVDISTGKMNAQLFNEAEGMKDRFETMVSELKDKVNATKDAIENMEPVVPALDVPDEIIEKAGFTYHTNVLTRALGTFMLKQNLDRAIGTPPSAMQWVYDNVMVAGNNSSFDIDRITRYGSEYDAVKDQKQRMKDAMDSSTLFLTEAMVRMEQVKGAAYEYREDAQESFDEMLAAMESSPVLATNLSVQQSADGTATASPSFSIDESKAAEQNEKGAALDELDEKMLERFEEAILATEKNLAAVDSMLTKPLERNTSQSTGGSGTYSYNTFAQDDNSIVSLANTLQLGTSYSATTYTIPDIATYYPSVSDITASLRRAVEEIDKYYAYEGSFRARQYTWLNLAHRGIRNKRPYLENAYDQVWSAVQNKSTSFQENNMKDRIELLYVIAQASTAEKNNAVNQAQLSADNFKESLRYTWYDMHDKGLLESKNQIAFNMAPDLAENKHDVKGIIDSPYRLLTEKIDETYTLKSEILSLLHGLYTQYDKYRTAMDSISSGGSTSSTVLQDVQIRLSSIESSLQPPTISSINVVSNRTHYRNEAKITWSSNSRPVETSFQFQEQLSGENNIETGFYEYRSLGIKNEVTIHSYKNFYPRMLTPDMVRYYETKRFDIGFRLRSAGGVTAIRRGNFDVAVGPGSDVSDIAIDIKETDTSDPSIDYVAFPDYYELADDPIRPFKEAYFTSEQQSQYLVVGARDDESDIVKYEYAVGSTRGGTDIQEWSLLTGRREYRTVDGYNGDYIRTDLVGRINSLSLQEGERYYFSARVTNGEGLSTTTTLSIPLAFDGTPPAAPAPRYTSVGFTPLFFGNSAVYPVQIKGLATSTPAYQPLTNQLESIYDRLENNPKRPEINTGWVATSDGESGIDEYQYIISKDTTVTEEDFAYAFTTEGTQITVRAQNNAPVGTLSEEEPLIARYAGGQVKDFGPHYLFVRAKNNASLFSDVTRIGPVRAYDSSRPDLPDMQVTERSNALRIHIVKNSFDPESGLKGYQYALGTSPNTADLKGFPSGSNVSWEYSNYDALLKGVNFNFSLSGGSSGPEQPTFDINKNDLPKGEPIYVFFRAVNNQGGKSAVVACGPIILDDTPPETPDITLSTTSDEKVKVQLNNVNDPESGITKVVYRVFWSDNGISKRTDHITAFQVNNPTTNSRDFTFYKYIGDYDPGSIRVGVWVYNGLDEYTYTSKSLPLQLSFDPNSTYQGNFQLNTTW